MLAWTIYITFIGVLVLMFLPRDNARAARIVALLTAIAGCVVAFVGAIQQTNPGEVTTIVKADWIPAIGANYYLAADGISLVLVVLTGLAAVSGILFSWNIEKRTKEFFAFYLALIGGVYGVFLSFDVLLLFVFYELTIIPKYFLIARWGSTRKEYGAMKLALYSFVGSHLVLIGLIAAWVVAKGQLGHASLDLIELSKVHFTAGFQHWVFPLVFVGFAILAGMWPFHTWAPTGHVAAPTAGSSASRRSKGAGHMCRSWVSSRISGCMTPALYRRTMTGCCAWKQIIRIGSFGMRTSMRRCTRSSRGLRSFPVPWPRIHEAVPWSRC